MNFHKKTLISYLEMCERWWSSRGGGGAAGDVREMAEFSRWWGCGVLGCGVRQGGEWGCDCSGRGGVGGLRRWLTRWGGAKTVVVAVGWGCAGDGGVGAVVVEVADRRILGLEFGVLRKRYVLRRGWKTLAKLCARQRWSRCILMKPFLKIKQAADPYVCAWSAWERQKRF
ncbi:hypothetical protein HanRHA438_Chr10g0440271 [Helianthus annuus]|nr:hypothetical protein HanRHA438_Chr10g0440271 [Helianthus annuus]KAJ0882721.1 hypothetical protein HanPSC8_Chr10g0412981 [Helianthus annuus]